MAGSSQDRLKGAGCQGVRGWKFGYDGVQDRLAVEPPTAHDLGEGDEAVVTVADSSPFWDLLVPLTPTAAELMARAVGGLPESDEIDRDAALEAKPESYVAGYILGVGRAARGRVFTLDSPAETTLSAAAQKLEAWAAGEGFTDFSLGEF